MKLTKFEQSGFILETESGFRLAFDIGNKTPTEKLEGIKVDAILVSHIHGDHFHMENIKKLSPQIVYLNKECIEVEGEDDSALKIVQIESDNDIFLSTNFTVKTFNVDHGPNISAPIAENFGFLFNVDGKTIYFAGDMFYASGIGITDLEVDYLLLPVGGFYTFGPNEAFDFAKKFRKIGKIITMHYDKNPETRDQFLALAKDVFEVI
ncbi:MAG: MBL fold metallo-hydrolase [Candidatus Zambryskibacteria bacterium]|nr:MBL fold metallo-hydrolase [Candidatus Zambryskibacteria bacterium]